MKVVPEFDEEGRGVKHTLERGFLDGWWVFEGGGNWAGIEGNSEEWRTIADAIDGCESVSYKRCAVQCVDNDDGEMRVVFWSPWNAWGNDDYVEMSKDEAAAFAAHVRSVVAESPTA